MLICICDVIYEIIYFVCAHSDVRLNTQVNVCGKNNNGMLSALIYIQALAGQNDASLYICSDSYLLFKYIIQPLINDISLFILITHCRMRGCQRLSVK